MFDSLLRAELHVYVGVVISLERVILSGPCGDGLVVPDEKFEHQVGQGFVDFDPLIEVIDAERVG